MDMSMDMSPKAEQSAPTDEPMKDSMPSLPLSMFPKGLKPGDTVSMKVEKIDGDQVTVSPVDDTQPMSDDEMKSMSSSAAESMPLDKLEKALPKASRE